MSFRTAYGYSHSENGWRMCDRNECVLVPGPYMNTAPIRSGPPAVILGDFARRYHAEVAQLVSPVWGWSAQNDVGNSNHLSGTALDLNATQWPWGQRRMPQWMIDKTNALLAFYEGVIFWGRNWTRADEMHFQIGVPEGNPALGRIVAKIQNGGVTDTLDEGAVTAYTAAFMGPIGSDAKDIRGQLTGGRDAGEYPGWNQLGKRSATDAIAAILTAVAK